MIHSWAETWSPTVFPISLSFWVMHLVCTFLRHLRCRQPDHVSRPLVDGTGTAGGGRPMTSKLRETDREGTRPI